MALFGKRTARRNIGTLSDIFPFCIVEGGTLRGTIVAVNDKLCALTGYSEEELVGAPLDRLVPKRSREIHKLDRARYMLAPEVRPMGAEREVLLSRADDSEINVWIGLAPANGLVAAVILPVDVAEPKPLNPP